MATLATENRGDLRLRFLVLSGLISFHRVLQGAPPRGRQVYFTFQVLETLYSKRQKHPFLPQELQPWWVPNPLLLTPG